MLSECEDFSRNSELSPITNGLKRLPISGYDIEKTVQGRVIEYNERRESHKLG